MGLASYFARFLLFPECKAAPRDRQRYPNSSRYIARQSAAVSEAWQLQSRTTGTAAATVEILVLTMPLFLLPTLNFWRIPA